MCQGCRAGKAQAELSLSMLVSTWMLPPVSYFFPISCPVSSLRLYAWEHTELAPAASKRKQIQPDLNYRSLLHYVDRSPSAGQAVGGLQWGSSVLPLCDFLLGAFSTVCLFHTGWPKGAYSYLVTENTVERKDCFLRSAKSKETFAEVLKDSPTCHPEQDPLHAPAVLVLRRG